MTSSLSIGRLHSHFRASHALDEHTIAQWHEGLREADASTLVDQLVGPDEWLLIRQLDLSVTWPVGSAPLEVGSQWSRALAQAVEIAAHTPHHPDVVRYASRRHGLADLIYRSALGQAQRQWAWRRMGWIDQVGQHPDQALHQGLSQLLAEPEWIWPLLNQWVGAEGSTGALSALLRSVPASWWSVLFMRCGATAPYAQALATSGQHAAGAAMPAQASAASLDGAGHARMHQSAPDLDPATLSGSALTLWLWLRQRPHLAAQHANTLSVLLSALAWPSRSTQPEQAPRRLHWAQQVLEQAAMPAKALRRGALDRLAAPVLPQAHRAAAADDGIASTQTRGLGEPTNTADTTPPATPADDELPQAPELPPTDTLVPTAWAGALFWLRHASQPGVLNQAPNLGQGDDTGHALLALARALGVPDGDAAQRAFVGDVWPQGPAHSGLPTWASAQVTQWAAWLAEQASDLPEPRVQTVCRRPGRLSFEPGWIELHLSLDDVDTRIRRLGLDVSPGHLPCLGCVLRICYD